MNKIGIIRFKYFTIMWLLTIIFMSSTSYAILLENINPQWKNKKRELSLCNPFYNPQSEQEAIANHLKFVEFFLRNETVSHLTEKQLANRKKYLGYLHEYWNEKKFPINDITENRVPIFIDNKNNFCAVGYLMKRSGYEQIARKIQQQNNLIFVKQIRDVEALHWIAQSGLSIEECAWIQPAYANPTLFNKCGKGTNGNIYTLKTINNELYVGGVFTKIDSTINSYGLAKLVKNNNIYQWEDFSQGLPIFNTNPAITIRAIQNFDNKIFVAGTNNTNQVYFETIYYREGNQFIKCDSIYGQVYDFEVYNGTLYVAGHFKNSITDQFALAHWDKNNKQWIPDYGVIPSWSNIYKMINFENKLVLAGAGFSSQNSTNIVSYDGQNTFPFYTGLLNDVYTLAVHNNQLYAAGEVSGPLASYTMKYFNGNNWIDTNHLYLPNAKSINTLYATSNKLFWGGDFKNYGMMHSAANLMCTNGPSGWGSIDTTVNAIEEFDGNLFVGGLFNTIENASNYNHITYISNNPSSISAFQNSTLKIYPNPAQKFIGIENVNTNSKFLISNMLGVSILKGKTIPHNKIDISTLKTGIYYLQIIDEQNTITTFKFIKN